MLMIRLSRVGKKKQVEYRLIINEKHKDPWGDVLEFLGYYNPRTKPAQIDFKAERIKYWLSQGAQMSDTVRNLLITQKIIEGEKVKPSGIKKMKKKDMKSAGDNEAKPAGGKAVKEEKPAAENKPVEVKAEPKAEKVEDKEPVEPVAAKPEEKTEVKAEVKEEKQEAKTESASEEKSKEENKEDKKE